MLVIKSYEELGRFPEVGDKVKIVSERKGAYWNNQGHMDKHLGTILTVVAVFKKDDPLDYEVGLSNGKIGRFDDAMGWVWFPWMIEGVVIDAVEDILEDPATWASGDALEALLT